MSTIQCSKFNLSERFFLFALEIVKLVRSLPNDPAAREIGKQLIRAGTSIAANYEEALGSFSRKDFTYKLSTASAFSLLTSYFSLLISHLCRRH